MYIQNSQPVTIRKSSIYLMAFCIFGFAFSSLLVFINLNEQIFDMEMIILSILFFFILTFTIVNEKEKLTPLVFFSLLFYGYIFSGFYFSYYENIYTAKFFNFSGNFTTQDMKVSLFQVVVGYIFFVIGYKISGRLKVKKINFEMQGIDYSSKVLKVFLVSLFLISFFYWVYVSFRLAGGPIELLTNMGIYLLLLENNYISTAPYHLSYAATSVLFLLYLINQKRIPIYLVLMILASFIMYVSTGRLSGAVFYLLSFPLMHLIYYQRKFNIKILIYVAFFVFFLGFLYFYRFYSNLQYIGIEMESDLLKLIGEHFFGMTNFGDLQSIAFANQYTQDVGYLYGASFTDFLMGWINRFPGIEIESTSIGLRLREFYFSHVSTGAPAPGTISEMIMNFGYLGITVIMFIFGTITRVLVLSVYYKLSILNLYIYINFLLFMLLLAKVDSSHISSLLWKIIPVILLLIVLLFISKIRISKK